ncbi:MAG TPA: GGDEF domain-containing protein [Tepidisphaeraceae bacterium]|nr:GGDEF domain-containing protein [Tepidisphaeraceae bacterium]
MNNRPENILLIADHDRQVHDALKIALPESRVHRVANWFDAIGELSTHDYTGVLASVEPIETRPEPAVRVVRELLGSGRLILFGHTTLEQLSRKMLECGGDDYIITPADPSELREALSAAQPVSREPIEVDDPSHTPTRTDSIAQIALDALLEHPEAPLEKIVEVVNKRFQLNNRLFLAPKELTGGLNLEGTIVEPFFNGEHIAGHIALDQKNSPNDEADRALLQSTALTLTKTTALHERHIRLQQAVIVDDLTGLYNGRYFRHFLNKILVRARESKFLVTLLLFDIDNFKKYNDMHGHGVGDEILRQTAHLMKRSCRDHDLVSRIAGDEFAVVFWEKEGPRVPRDPSATGHSRVPQTPLMIAQRFRRLLNSSEFSALGEKGRGTLSISGGMAVFPHDANTAESLIEAADRALMFGAKRGGKDAIFLVGSGLSIDTLGLH